MGFEIGIDTVVSFFGAIIGAIVGGAVTYISLKIMEKEKIKSNNIIHSKIFAEIIGNFVVILHDLAVELVELNHNNVLGVDNLIMNKSEFNFHFETILSDNSNSLQYLPQSQIEKVCDFFNNMMLINNTKIRPFLKENKDDPTNCFNVTNPGIIVANLFLVIIKGQILRYDLIKNIVKGDTKNIEIDLEICFRNYDNLLTTGKGSAISEMIILRKTLISQLENCGYEFINIKHDY